MHCDNDELLEVTQYYDGVYLKFMKDLQLLVSTPRDNSKLGEYVSDIVSTFTTALHGAYLRFDGKLERN
ncbi:hypothetical protein RSAG8_13661, partial [Rhizoctonia solani AG-8 WAC10335]